MLGNLLPRQRLIQADEATDPDTRYVDLAIRFRIKGTNTRTKVYGGVWDTHANCWVPRYLADGNVLHINPAATPKKVRTYSVTRKQLGAILCGKRRVFIKGARGGGKSHTIALKCIYNWIRFPEKAGQVVSPTYRKSKIIWRKLAKLIPRHWLLPGLLGIRKSDRVYHFITTGWVQFISADNPDALRGEDLAWAVIDETQDVSEEAWGTLWMSLRDAGPHMQLTEAGTPKMGEMYVRYLRYKKDPKAAIYTLRGRENPFIDHSIFDDAKELLDDRQYRQEAEGEFVPQEGRAFPSWARPLHVRPVPSDAVDITAAFLREYLEIERPDFRPEFVLGVDYGGNAQWAVLYKLFEGNVLWAIREWYVEGTADDLAHEFRKSITLCGREYKSGIGHLVAVIDDAAGQYSRGGHTGSAAFRKLGIEVYHPTKNPPIVDRVASTSGKLRNTHGRTSYYVDPVCARLIIAFDSQEFWDKKSGHDHILDAATYPVHYLFPSYQAWTALDEAA